MELDVTTLAERPELTDALNRMPDNWPEFVLEDNSDAPPPGRR